MCGIAGFSHLTSVTQRMIPHLLWDIESRGNDSWGATDGTHTIKVIGPVTSSYLEHEDEILGWDRAIFHTRAASTGSVSIPNQHPYRFEHATPEGNRVVVGIHNGIISNHLTLNHKYHRNFDVDSMHIFANIAEGKPTGELFGYGNLAWYEFTPAEPDGVLHILRFNNDALHVAKLTTGEIVFCSTENPIHRAARMAGSRVKHFYDITNEWIYTPRYENGQWILYKSGSKMTFGTRGWSSSGTAGDMTVWGRRGRSTSFTTQTRYDEEQFRKGVCLTSACSNIVRNANRNTAVICDECLEKCRRAVSA